MTAATALGLKPRTFLWRSRNWISLIVLAPVIVVTLFSSPAWPLGFWGEFACEAAGWALFLAGAIFRWWGTLYISGRKDQQIISQGPYAMVRHPLYFGTFLLGLSFAAFLQSVSLLVGLLFAAIVYLGITLPREEKRLVEIYGEAYRKYQERTPRFIPNFSAYSSPETISVNLSGMRAELYRMLRWCTLPLVAHWIAQARLEAWWPHWMTLP